MFPETTGSPLACWGDAMSVTVTKDNVKNVVKQINALTRKRVLVGIPAEAAAREDDKEINNAAIGYINEFGRPEANIPPRPHLVPGVADANAEITKGLKSAGAAALSGDKAKTERGLVYAGEAAVASVRAKIAAVIPPSLSKRTLDARKARGNEGETPLIDTGEYNQHITYVIRETK